MYYLNLDENNYLLSVSSVGVGISIESLDGYDLSGSRINAYRWNGQTLELDEERLAEIEQENTVENVHVVTQADRIEAQVFYTAMMTDTLLEV